MSDFVISSHEINSLLRDAVSELPGAQPKTIVVLALTRIKKADRDAALLILLENQLSRVFAYDRPQVPSRSNGIAAIRDSGEDPAAADKRLNRADPMAQRVWARSRALDITYKEARGQLDVEDGAARVEIEERVREGIRALAEMNRKADIAEALNRRVQVRRVYKMLLDCTLDEVEWLAKNATNIALGHIHSAAFYQDIANRMKEAGASLVGEIVQKAVPV